RDDAFLQRRGGHRHLESRSRRVASLYRAVVQRAIFVARQRCPGHTIDACGEGIRIVRGPAREAEHVTARRIEYHRPAVEAGPIEAGFDRLLHVDVDGELQPLALGRLLFFERSDFPADAVDDDALGAVLAHQHRVVDLFDARLPNDVAALQAAVTARDLGVV